MISYCIALEVAIFSSIVRLLSFFCHWLRYSGISLCLIACGFCITYMDHVSRCIRHYVLINTPELSELQLWPDSFIISGYVTWHTFSWWWDSHAHAKCIWMGLLDLLIFHFLIWSEKVMEGCLRSHTHTRTHCTHQGFALLYPMASLTMKVFYTKIEEKQVKSTLTSLSFFLCPLTWARCHHV